MAFTEATAAPIKPIEFDHSVVVAGADARSPATTAPDALVIDLGSVIGTDPLRLCRETARRSPATEIIGFGPKDRLADGFQLLRLGAVSWVTGPYHGSTDDDTVGAVLRGETVVHSRHAAWIMADFTTISARASGPDPRYNLTATERDVLTRLAKDDTPAEIAAFHDVDVPLVNRHVRLALKRLQRHRR